MEPLYDGSDMTYYAFIKDFAAVENFLESIYPELAATSFPVQVIWGAHDPILVAAEQIDKIKEIFTDHQIQITLLEDKKHFIPLEAADHIVEILVEE